MPELPALLYYLLMLAGSVSLGKIVFLLAAGGGGLPEDERATGIASITGLAIVAVAIALELFLLKGAAFPAVAAFAGLATIGSRALLLKRPVSLPALKLEQMMAEMEEGNRDENATKAGHGEQSVSGGIDEKTGALAKERGTTPSQKIGEVIRLQGGKSEREKTGEKRRKPGEGGFEEIKWEE